MKKPKIPKAVGRSVAEWIGKTPDAKIPPRIVLRVLRRAGNTCALTGLTIVDGQPYDIDHIKRLEDGGEHRESNLQPVLKAPHAVKTAVERKNAAKADRAAKRAHGLVETKAKIANRGFPKSGPERAPKLQLSSPRRSFYRDINAGDRTQ